MISKTMMNESQMCKFSYRAGVSKHHHNLFKDSLSNYIVNRQNLVNCS